MIFSCQVEVGARESISLHFVEISYLDYFIPFEKVTVAYRSISSATVYSAAPPSERRKTHFTVTEQEETPLCLLPRDCQIRGSCDSLSLPGTVYSAACCSQHFLAVVSLSNKLKKLPGPILKDIKSRAPLHCQKSTLVISRPSCHLRLTRRLMPLIFPFCYAFQYGGFDSHGARQPILLDL